MPVTAMRYGMIYSEDILTRQTYSEEAALHLMKELYG